MRLSSRTLIFRFLRLQTFITTCHISATFQKSVAEPWEQLNVLWCRACKIYTFQHFGQCTGRSSKRKNLRGMGPIWVRLSTFCRRTHSLPLCWVQLWHWKSNHWADLTTGGQLKGWISTVYPLTCGMLAWAKLSISFASEKSSLDIYVSHLPNSSSVFLKFAVLAFGVEGK